ncbi:MAG TPA: glycosyltransferase [Thermoanaerobaculia bacterium]|jgi:glycosyltransferase involved in cell wall biosynthesis
MIVTRVIRDEGVASTLRRTRERIAEAIEDARFFSSANAPVINVAPGGTGSRTGGVAVQLRARLRVERAHRPVMLTDVPIPAKSIHFEGAGTVSDAPYIVSVHDLTQLENREFLSRAAAVVFASSYLRERYGVPGQVIEPGLSVAPAILPAKGSAIAFAGAVQRHKGGHLLPTIAKALHKRRETLHVFGRGDADLLRALRAMNNVKLHGYYPGGTLPSLLQRHGIGLVLVPSIVPEAFCLTISEAWAAGAAVGAFDIGAQGERIRRQGGGWVAPLESGAEGILQIIDRRAPIAIPHDFPRAEESARAYLDLYRRLGWLG